MLKQFHVYLFQVRERTVGFALVAALAAFLVLGRSGMAADDFQQLVDQIPRSANAVVLLDMESAKSSSMGLKNNWKTKIESAFEAGLIRVPPKATRFVLASQIDLEFMEPLWKVAIMDFDENISMKRIAKMRGGTLDTIEDLPALVMSNDTYLVQLGPQTLGVMGPANRQVVVRWLREVRKPTPRPLSAYLQKAANFSDGTGSQIIMAVDLDGALSFERVAKYLKSKDNRLDQWQANLMQLTKLISNVRGIRIGVRIGEEPSAKIAVDFHQDASSISSFTKPLLLQVLSDLGASINGLQSWTEATKGNEISLSGRLTSGGLRRLMSVIESPVTSDPVVHAKETVSPGDLPDLQIKASRDHFHAVTRMFNDLKEDMRNSKNLASTSLWFDKYARRIERLPILHVDEDMLNYSAFVADSLRQAGGTVRTMGIQSNVRQKQIISSSAGYGYTASYRHGRYGSYGGYGVAYNPAAEMKGIAAERRVVRAEEKAVAATDVQQLRQAVISATTDIRRKMTQKYQVEF